MLQWLVSKITQGRLWYFRAFKMRGMPRLPDDFVNLLRAEQQAKEQENRRVEKREELERLNAARQFASSQEESRREESRRKERKQEEGKRDEHIPDERDRIPKSWLQEKISLQQAEADNTRAEGDVPFGGQNDRWERLKASLQSGDEIWVFCSPSESWQHCAGRSGVAVVREGFVADCLVTMMN
jgi:hypothetical protein